MVCCVLQLEELESLSVESMVVAARGCRLYCTIQEVGSSVAIRLAPERIASSSEVNIFQNTATALENTNHSNHTYSLRSVLSGTHHEEIGARWQDGCEGNVACLQPDAWSLSCGIHTMG